MARQSAVDLAREIQKQLGELETDFVVIKSEVERANLNQLRDRVISLEEKVTELKRVREETDRRHWQFIYIFAGAMASLLCTIVVQLVLFVLKK